MADIKKIKVFFWILFCTIYLIPQIIIWCVRDKPIYDSTNGYLLNCTVANINYPTDEITFNYQNCSNYFTEKMNNEIIFENDIIPCYGLIYIGEDPCDNHLSLRKTKRIEYLSIVGIITVVCCTTFFSIIILFFLYNKRLNQ